MMWRIGLPIVLAGALALSLSGSAIAERQGKPAAQCSAKLLGTAQEFAVTLTMSDARTVPVTVFAPAQPGRYPLIAFSHGALAAPDRYRKLLRPLAAAGFVIVAPMHLESEELVKPAVPSPDEVWRTRAADLEMALAPPQAITKGLRARSLKLDLRHVIVMGHSFGALLAQIAAGARAHDPGGNLTRLAAPRLAAVVAWSPPGPMPKVIDADGWSSLNVPSMLLTGTADQLAVMTQPWEWHMASFDGAPSGTKRAWIGQGVDHYFNGSFGREKPVAAERAGQFQRALSQVLAFMEQRSGRSRPCTPSYDARGETLKTG